MQENKEKVKKVVPFKKMAGEGRFSHIRVISLGDKCIHL